MLKISFVWYFSCNANPKFESSFSFLPVLSSTVKYATTTYISTFPFAHTTVIFTHTTTTYNCRLAMLYPRNSYSTNSCFFTSTNIRLSHWIKHLHFYIYAATSSHKYYIRCITSNHNMTIYITTFCLHWLDGHVASNKLLSAPCMTLLEPIFCPAHQDQSFFLEKLEAHWHEIAHYQH